MLVQLNTLNLLASYNINKICAQIFILFRTPFTQTKHTLINMPKSNRKTQTLKGPYTPKTPTNLPLDAYFAGEQGSTSVSAQTIAYLAKPPSPRRFPEYQPTYPPYDLNDLRPELEDPRTHTLTDVYTVLTVFTEFTTGLGGRTGLLRKWSSEKIFIPQRRLLSIIAAVFTDKNVGNYREGPETGGWEIPCLGQTADYWETARGASINQRLDGHWDEGVLWRVR